MLNAGSLVREAVSRDIFRFGKATLGSEAGMPAEERRVRHRPLPKPRGIGGGEATSKR